MPGFDPRPAVSRRVLLGAACGGVGALATASVAAEPAAPAAPQASPPSAWAMAESLPLWTGDAPGFDSAKVKSGGSSYHLGMLRNIGRPELKVFRPRRSNGRALLSIPGGGYAIVSILNEGLDVARRMTAAGYTVFVLAYRLPAEGWRDRADVPLQDAQRAMRIIRSQSARYGFDPQKVAAVGFSAGGHLAASLATGFAEALYAPRDDLDRLDARPAATGLIYPVITLEQPYGHRGSTVLLLGRNPAPELVARRSPLQHVTDVTPPVFLTHAVDDDIVPMQNSLMMLEAMKAARRPVEAHVFAEGGHGFGLGPRGARCAEWPGLFTSWLDRTLTA